MSEIIIPLSTVRQVMLATQGLLQPPAQAADKAAVLETIRRMGVLQIDTIHVVARSPYLVLWSRLGSYNPTWLDELLAEGALFEYWAHAACFLPIEDYPLFRYRMLKYEDHYYKPEWGERHREGIERILDHIWKNGEVRSADFERKDGQKGGWWNWKEEKQVLEYLHTVGEIMIVRREKFQRVYDLRERVLPGWDESMALSTEEARIRLTAKAARSLGIAHPRWLPDYFRLPKTGLQARIKALEATGEIQPVQVEGWKEPGYIHADNLPLLQQSRAGELRPTFTTLLSPFDPLVWDRERARALFNFDYTIECYLPVEKRIYGYFSLPILYQGVLVGRLDAKAYRKEGVFEVKALYLEPGTAVNEDLVSEISGAITRCAEWHGTPKVILRKCEPPILNEMFPQQWSAEANSQVIE